ncbi:MULTISPECIES: phage antirepressor N-terminal domain-containing protein [Symbiopectobacterium]|uniref:phage antirepressor N-terminal domain-containing protein n=1 Tax=Symbiopectobacterium TaxID=801 RepID=UPI001A1850E5|nr:MULTISPECIES: phage antirepressor N-terminal domain-containing protein [Symbiopectobacterium]MBG6247015.1 hypothetical protein [Candidatus Symbiopectobacterium sp. PLON1]MBT9429086.1 hypothetical protein [Candidatus Symbiopectobacterium endolongispinus]
MQYPVSAEVTFNGDRLVTVIDNNIEYVAMGPIVENIGLSWASQSVKLNSQMGKFNCCDIETVASDGRVRAQLCIPLRKLNGWLFSINPAKVKESIRSKLIAYQEECFAVLHDYWTRGVAINPRKQSVMEELNQACANMKHDKRIASMFGTGLNEWKGVKANHVSKIKALVQEANELIDYVLADTGKGKITHT